MDNIIVLIFLNVHAITDTSNMGLDCFIEYLFRFFFNNYWAMANEIQPDLNFLELKVTKQC